MGLPQEGKSQERGEKGGGEADKTAFGKMKGMREENKRGIENEREIEKEREEKKRGRMREIEQKSHVGGNF